MHRKHLTSNLDSIYNLAFRLAMTCVISIFDTDMLFRTGDIVRNGCVYIYRMESLAAKCSIYKYIRSHVLHDALYLWHLCAYI